MYTSGTPNTGYANSDMVKADNTYPEGQDGSTLHDIYTKYIQPDFDTNGTHVIPYQNALSNQIDETATNRMGNSNTKGASSSFGWYPRKLDLMSEMNVYGGIVASSSFYDTGIDNRQYAIFRLKPELINSYNGERFNVNWWLKDVASSTNFTRVGRFGDSYASDASSSLGVRPRFLIG